MSNIEPTFTSQESRPGDLLLDRFGLLDKHAASVYGVVMSVISVVVAAGIAIWQGSDPEEVVRTAVFIVLTGVGTGSLTKGKVFSADTHETELEMVRQAALVEGGTKATADVDAQVAAAMEQRDEAVVELLDERFEQIRIEMDARFTEIEEQARRDALGDYPAPPGSFDGDVL